MTSGPEGYEPNLPSDNDQPPEGSLRAQRRELYEDDEGEGSSDALGVLAMFGMVFAMGACCLAGPALLAAGTISLGSLAGWGPWAIAGGLLAGGAWAAYRYREPIRDRLPLGSE